jgi:NAD(P)-dependent dehydrogenase (short-subunit alcohol dehydrogenase family)
VPIDVHGKVVIVTGGAGELGSAMARQLSGDGARVVIADIRDGGALEAELCRDGEARFVRADVTDEAATRRLVEEAKEQYGRIDVLINCAGDVTPKAFEDLDLATWRDRFRVNVDSAFLCTRAVLPAMKEQRKGRIINIGSDTVWMGTPGLAHYVASKGALLALTRALAHELGPLGITTVFVSPTLLDTPGTRRTFQQGHFDWVLSHTPIGRLETPRDVCGLIVFLCSDAADFINGSAINIGGGISMH